MFFNFLEDLLTCKSFIGFQSCSTKITVSAPVKLSPSPPTCVVKRRMSIDGSLLNLNVRMTIVNIILTINIILLYCNLLNLETCGHNVMNSLQVIPLFFSYLLLKSNYPRENSKIRKMQRKLQTYLRFAPQILLQLPLHQRMS